MGDRAVLVLYDEGCGICTAFAARLATHAAAAAPIGSPEGERWLRDLSTIERYAAFHVIDNAGRRRSGGAGVPLVLDAFGRRGFARVARAMPRATDDLYSLLARSRGALSRLAGTATCAQARSKRASRERAG